MSKTSNTIESTLADAAGQLASVSESPRLDAEIILAWVLDAPRSYLIAHCDEALENKASTSFSTAIARRTKGEPVAYITGRKEFWSLDLKVSRDTLVPRPETELLVEKALALISPDSAGRVLALGTGSGAIAIAIASERRRGEIVATDIDDKTLKIAKENAARHSVENISFVRGSWTEPVDGQLFDIVVSNPPYVRDDDPALDRLSFEPRAALASGPEGMDAISKIAEDVAEALAANGVLLIEHGAGQQDAVAEVLRINGWTDIGCFNDLAGQPRVTTARMGTPTSQDQP